MNRFILMALASFLLSQFRGFAQKTLALPSTPASSIEQVLSVTDGKLTSELPVKIFRGAKTGPTMTVLAGIHGYEYPPIIAMQRLMAEIDPDKLAGTLILVPVANTQAFFGRSVFYNPADGKNLNRVFPGDTLGSISERLAALITRELINRSDIFIDIHAGDANEDLTDFVCYYDNKDTPEQTALAARLSYVAGFPYEVVYPFQLTEEQRAEYAFKQATRSGVTALSLEAGKLGNVQETSVRRITQAIYNMLSELKMYSKERISAVDPLTILNGLAYIKAPDDGIFYSTLRSGDQVSAGQLLGYITNLFGKRIADIKATHSGLILYKTGTPPVNKDETLFCIGYSI